MFAGLFPRNPTKETEKWCRTFDIGREIVEPCAYMLGNIMIVHPDIWKAMEKELAK